MSENNNSWDRQRIGGLWRRESKKNGTKYLTGKVTLDNQDYSLIIFPTKEKKTDKSPDFVVYLSEDKPAANAQQPAPRQNTQQPRRQYNNNTQNSNARQQNVPQQPEEFI